MEIYHGAFRPKSRYVCTQSAVHFGCKRTVIFYYYRPTFLHEALDAIKNNTSCSLFGKGQLVFYDRH